MIPRSLLTALFLSALTLATGASASAADSVVVVVGLGAPELEHVAAQELVSQFRKLFDAKVVLTDYMPDKHENLVLVGGPKKNKAVREIMGDTWPKLSDQGFILRSFKTDSRSGVVVAGDSSVATLWAVYELGHQLGIRYLLREDIYPDRQPLELGDLNLLMEPELKSRAWTTLGLGVTGLESWSAADQKKLLRQLAKKKFNQLVLSVEPWQPFVDYSFRGVSKRSPGIWHGERFSIPRDAPGRTAFGAATEFTNPDFDSDQTPAKRANAGIKHLRGIISTAQRLGISATIELAPFEFPHEFEPAVSGLVAVPGTQDLAVHPGPNLKPDDAVLKELVAAQLRAYVETYPDVDKLQLTVPATGDWQNEVASIWQQITKQRGSATPELSLQAVEAADGKLFGGNLGVLSQATTRRQHVTLDRQRAQGGDSFATRYAMLAEVDPTIHYLSRAAWDKNVTARSAHDDLFTTITGDQAIADRLWLGFGHIEAATELTADKDRDFAVPSPDMLMKHYQNEPAPEWWEPLTEHYTQAMIEMYRSRGPAHPRAQPFLFYYAKRSEYVLEYLGCVKAVRAAAIAKQGGDSETAIEQLETAIESLYNAIDTLGDVAQDPSDRGLIAALNAYAYRPLLAEYERLLEEE